MEQIAELFVCTRNILRNLKGEMALMSSPVGSSLLFLPFFGESHLGTTVVSIEMKSHSTGDSTMQQQFLLFPLPVDFWLFPSRNG